jgi:hypothetical protein
MGSAVPGLEEVDRLEARRSPLRAGDHRFVRSRRELRPPGIAVGAVARAEPRQPEPAMNHSDQKAWHWPVQR